MRYGVELIVSWVGLRTRGVVGGHVRAPERSGAPLPRS
jgi:hypothetical protein